PRQGAFVERNSRDGRDIVFAARGKQFVLWILIEDVIDDLDGIDQPALHRFDTVPRFPTIDADADRADQVLRSKFIHLLRPTIVLDPRVFPDVTLEEIEARQ